MVRFVSNRSIVALAVVAAVSAAVAIVPPGGATARGIRIERMGQWSSGRPLLLRLSVEDGGTRHWHAPASLELSALDADGLRHHARLARAGRGPWIFTALPAMRAPVRIEARAEGLNTSTLIRSDGDSPAFVLGDHGRATMDIATEGYVLTPEVGGTVILSAGIAHAGEAIEVHGDDPTLAIGPERATLDACGMLALYARPAGLAAPILCRLGTSERRFRVPLAPGAITTRLDGATLSLAHALGGVTAHVITGDARGPLRWAQVPIETATDRTSAASFALRDDERWALASASAEFDRVSGGWRDVPPGLTPCAQSPLGAYYARIAAPTPPLPPIVLAADGAGQALDAREARRQRTRRSALWITALALSGLSALMLSATRTPEQALEREGLTAGSDSMRTAAYGVVALSAMAFAIAIAVQLRT